MIWIVKQNNNGNTPEDTTDSRKLSVNTMMLNKNKLRKKY